MKWNFFVDLFWGFINFMQSLKQLIARFLEKNYQKCPQIKNNLHNLKKFRKNFRCYSRFTRESLLVMFFPSLKLRKSTPKSFAILRIFGATAESVNTETHSQTIIKTKFSTSSELGGLFLFPSAELDANRARLISSKSAANIKRKQRRGPGISVSDENKGDQWKTE